LEVALADKVAKRRHTCRITFSEDAFGAWTAGGNGYHSRMVETFFKPPKSGIAWRSACKSRQHTGKPSACGARLFANPASPRRTGREKVPGLRRIACFAGSPLRNDGRLDRHGRRPGLLERQNPAIFRVPAGSFGPDNGPGWQSENELFAISRKIVLN
jgi:hypothetical protein